MIKIFIVASFFLIQTSFCESFLGADALVRFLTLDAARGIKIVKSRTSIDKLNMKKLNTSIYENQKIKITIDVFQGVEFKEYKGLHDLYLNSLIKAHNKRTNPYTGEASSSAECSKEDMPTLTDISFLGTNGTVLLVNSTASDAIGVCQGNLIEKKVAIMLGYDFKSKVFYQLRIFIPKNIYKESDFRQIAKDLEKLRYN